MIFLTFSLVYFQNTVYNTYNIKIRVNTLTVLSVRSWVNSRLLSFETRLYMDFQLCEGVAAPRPHTFQGLTGFHATKPYLVKPEPLRNTT